ncbi:MAG: Sec-independent protein translocase protein TatB [Natronospirillum sp.]|uniref:Sec-independent protein translocase protein TatB n=1 Tax=Natronospirillum sp. TaxID=2812955 RepID=UPI0025E5BBAE|nr:Sec-independent protein translocase protein TatB [Natronospirillum sp.]MCH8550431.1 Sec-independent protein translocase protein TatB [Natronospirillum sp.]
MFDMGFLELALIAGIGLVVLGPERLPEAARTVGRYVGQMRRFVGNFQRQIEQEVRLEELNRKIMEETEDQSFTNNDGSTTPPRRQPVENDPGFYAEYPERKPKPEASESPTETPASAENNDNPATEKPPEDRP